MKLNLKSIKENSGDGEYSPISEGRYDLEIESGQEKTARSGNQMLEFTLKVIGPDFANRKVWANISLLESAQIYLIRLLEAAGKEEVIQEDVSSEDVIKALVGQKVSGYIKQRTNPNSGKTTNSVENFAEPMGVGSSATDNSGSSGESTKSKLFK